MHKNYPKRVGKFSFLFWKFELLTIFNKITQNEKQ